MSGDRIGYIIGVALLIGGGIYLQSPILNWICGPLLIVLSVVAVGHLQDRLRSRSTEDRK